ncbi:hypothetical protein JL722_6308 [Aureococcus anophagefferens]|nr:hypothetical protein JL722_6308 [Aureococcus anophagefferens]
MNFYSSGLVLQANLEVSLQKKTGSLYGPPGACHMVYFIDDLNLPELDKYNTQSAIALVRQHLDYTHWYDITKLALKTVEKCQYVAAMNPTAGSFHVNPRLQRHFTTFAVSMPSDQSLGIIYDAKKGFGEFNLSRFYGETRDPLTFCHFIEGIGEDPIYDQIHELAVLQKILDQALEEYNESNAQMDLVLFEDALNHICRITRIINNPQGHALLVGVGGSGKKSLSRLSSFICGFQTTMIQISATYGINDLKVDLQAMYNRAGVKSEGVMFLFTDAEITNERFLVYLNDLLGSADIADLYAQDEKDTEVRKNLHVVLCFSPVGEAFRMRCRKFPALVNCTVIDWFQPWPKQALYSVGCKFLAQIEDLGGEEVRQQIENFMPYSFDSTNKAAVEYFDMDGRYVYDAQKATADGIAKRVKAEKEVVEMESENASIEEKKVTKIAAEVTAKQQSAEADLAKAVPAVEAAMAALDTL